MSQPSAAANMQVTIRSLAAHSPEDSVPLTAAVTYGLFHWWVHNNVHLRKCTYAEKKYVKRMCIRRNKRCSSSWNETSVLLHLVWCTFCGNSTFYKNTWESGLLKKNRYQCYHCVSTNGSTLFQKIDCSSHHTKNISLNLTALCSLIHTLPSE